MTLAFILTMPVRKSWNGKWTGDESVHAIVKSGRTKSFILNAAKLLVAKRFTWCFSDGWLAAVEVKEVAGKEVRELKKESVGFAGYDWMVGSLLKEGHRDGKILKNGLIDSEFYQSVRDKATADRLSEANA
jgi:hypothetical protein